MKVIHKNSREEFNLTEPTYWKYSSMYGYLVLMNRRIFLIVSVDDMFYLDITDDFEVLD